MQLHKRRVRVFALTTVTAVVAATVLAACSSGSTKNASNTATTPAATNAASGSASSSASAEAPTPMPVKISLIGPPPLSASLWADVAVAQGYFKDVGLNPSFKYFGHGTDVIKTVLAKSVDIGGMGPTTATLQLVSQGSPMVMVAGMDNQDWLIGVSDPAVKTCQDLKGQTIADDGPNNARRLFLSVLLKSCGLTLDDTKHVAIGSTPADIIKASINGQVKASILHAPELAQIQAAAKVTTWHGVNAPNSVVSAAHYEAFTVLKDYLASPDGKTVTERTIAAYILARAWIMDPANEDAFAALTAKAQGLSVPVAKTGNKLLTDAKFWQPGIGLTQANMEGEIQLLTSIGTIAPDKAPKYADIVDTTIYPAALAIAEKIVPGVK
jgi:NitT/TauT family transport system substrate-binding protein